MVELVYGHLNDATTQAAIVKLPTPETPKLGDVVVSAADLTKERRLYGFAQSAVTPELKLVVPTDAVEPRAPRLALVPPILAEDPSRTDDEVWPFVDDEPTLTTGAFEQTRKNSSMESAWTHACAAR
jgi:hypothetical protein